MINVILFSIRSEDALTHQYGFVQFNDNELDENTRLSQYVHLALKTDAQTVVKFMREAWQLKAPDLIISIAGGAKHFDLSARLRKAFQLGLVSAAATTSKPFRWHLFSRELFSVDAWIITTGTNAGVVKEVGQALNTYRYKNQKDGIEIPCIGIASWGYTAGKNQLDRSMSASTCNSTGELSIVTMPIQKYRYNLGVDAIQMVGSSLLPVSSCVCVIWFSIERRRGFQDTNVHSHRKRREAMRSRT